MSASIFAFLATLFFVPSVAFICAYTMKQVAKDIENRGSYQYKMFVRVFMAEILPKV